MTGGDDTGAMTTQSRRHHGQPVLTAGYENVRSLHSILVALRPDIGGATSLFRAPRACIKITSDNATAPSGRVLNGGGGAMPNRVRASAAPPRSSAARSRGRVATLPWSTNGRLDATRRSSTVDVLFGHEDVLGPTPSTPPRLGVRLRRLCRFGVRSAPQLELPFLRPRDLRGV